MKFERKILILNTDRVQGGYLKPNSGWSAKGKLTSTSENFM